MGDLAKTEVTYPDLFEIPLGGSMLVRHESAMRNGILENEHSMKSVFIVDSAGPVKKIGANVTPWRFRFLEYVQGAVTTCPYDGGVLTGPMTGCWVFQMNDGGMPKIAHIGTLMSPDSKESKFVKAAWRAKADTVGLVRNVEGNEPKTFIGDGNIYMEAQKANGSPYNIAVCAYFERNQAWSLLLVPQGGMTKIAMARPMVLLPWSRVKHIQTFHS